MKAEKEIPKRLYRYREFCARTLDMLVKDDLHFSDPATFNDPLDTQPSLAIDVDDDELKGIVWNLAKERSVSEKRVAAEFLRRSGVRLRDELELAGQRDAERVIAGIEYLAREPGCDYEVRRRSLLRDHVERELRRRYDKGIVSLAQKADCPLMWSHYGDEHRGICIGYSVPASTECDVHKVLYGGSRLVQASKVAAMLTGDSGARMQVDEAVLLQKAGSWRYEREWRLIGRKGHHYSPLELEEIIFGMRCEMTTKYVVMKALERRMRPVKFYEMRESSGTFKLRKCVLGYQDELFREFPKHNRSILEAFEALHT